jgi:hypothetical protein
MGGKGEDDGPSICLSGNAKTQGSDHNKAHEGTDPRIAAVGSCSLALAVQAAMMP